MGELEKDFVPKDRSLRLKALGFDKPCFRGWDTDGVIWYHPDSDIVLDNPTFSQAFRWFRENHILYSHVRESYSFDNTLEFVSQINDSYVNHGIVDKPINRFETYEEAELACLDKLIEIIESKSESNGN